MPEWWSVLAVFWTLYLIDGIRVGRRDRIAFHAATGWARGRAKQASWHLPPALPSAWAITVDDLPCSLAPEGVTNWPSASAARPPPLPDAVLSFRWEDIGDVTARAGWIRLNGRRFTPVTAALSAAELKRLAQELAPLGPAGRIERLRRWQARRFRPLRQRRRLRLALGRSRGLVELNSVQVVFLLMLTAYVLLGGPEHLPAEVRDWIAAVLPWWLTGYGVLHLVAVGWFWRLHRQLVPEAVQDRLGLIMNALLVPPQALRLRQHLVANLSGVQHPLATALAMGNAATVANVTRDTLADLRWPRVPERLPAEARQIAASAATLFEPLVARAIADARPELSADNLLAPPAPSSKDACAWCPRCGDQFVRRDARCPHGVTLQILPAKRPERVVS